MDFDRKSINDETKQTNNSFSVLSYNVWFDETYRIERSKKIIDLISIYDPDVICFQELTEKTFEIFEHDLSESYYIFQIFSSEGNPYGAALAFKRDTVKLVDKPYYFDYVGCTNMGRRIIGCEVKIAGTKIHFLTTHLESLPKNAHIRSKQFNVLNKVIADLDNVIIAGDFNITCKNEEIERKILSSRLEDCWIRTGASSRIAWSYDGRRNKNILNPKLRSRLDRIYYCKGSKDFRAIRMQLIGMSDVSDEIQIPPSDHFGLMTNFVVREYKET